MMENYDDESAMYEHCKDCDGLEACLELARASEPWFTVKCPVFPSLKRTIKGD
jgi:hypothetical protein